MRIYLQTAISKEHLLRYYQLSLQEDLLGGWSLVKQWGLQGWYPGTLRSEHYATHEEALEALLHTRDVQLKHGYRVVFFQGDGRTG